MQLARQQSTIENQKSVLKVIEKIHKSYYEVTRSEIYLIRMANFVKIFLFLSELSLAKLQRSPGTPDIGHGGESEI